jgi:two-component system response regulator FlrC
LIDTPSTHALRAELRRLARFDRGPGAAPPILITGENGIGKGILARAIHGLSRRAAAPFVVVPCLALPADLLEVEIFGDERRALGSPRPGLLELANGGTLLLDGVHRIPLDLQARLLEALEERLVRRLGGSAPRSLEVRVIAATDVDLERAVRSGAFRKDLLQRLNRLTLPVRPLRERPDDIVPLARHFANRFARLRGLPHVRLTSGAERRLRAHTWPGNVRELSRVMERAAARRAGEEIGVDDLQLPGRAPRRPRTRMP